MIPSLLLSASPFNTAFAVVRDVTFTAGYANAPSRARSSISQYLAWSATGMEISVPQFRIRQRADVTLGCAHGFRTPPARRPSDIKRLRSADPRCAVSFRVLPANSLLSPPGTGLA